MTPDITAEPRRRRPSWPALVGFFLTAVAAVTGGWSLQEFCWSTWLSGLVFSWTCVVMTALQLPLSIRKDRSRYERVLPALRRAPDGAVVVAVSAASAAAACLALWIYSYLFGFYGLFLSVFAAMEPGELFGQNGFINSDFVTPVLYLASAYWPMALGVLIASARGCLRGDPWTRILLPLRAEVIRIHVFILALPFAALVAWLLLGERFHGLAIVLLSALLFLFSRPREQR